MTIETAEPGEAPREVTEEGAASDKQDREGEAKLATVPLFTSNAEFSFDEALAVTPRRGARLIMLMGEVGVGKTTVMVELWTRLVGVAAIAGYRFAGSRNAMAFEERAYLSRMVAGVETAATARTHYGENEGLLHLAVGRPDRRRVDLLFADYSGERYELVRGGHPALTELPWTPRADRVAVVVKGSSLRDPGTREVETNNASRLLLQLRQEGAVHPGTGFAVILARDDQVDEKAFAAAKARLDNLVQLAQEFDPGAALIRVAARPRDGSDPYGLGELLEWLCADDPPPVTRSFVAPPPRRAIDRLREGA
jgi:hypothetical protein